MELFKLSSLKSDSYQGLHLKDVMGAKFSYITDRFVRIRKMCTPRFEYFVEALKRECETFLKQTIHFSQKQDKIQIKLEEVFRAETQYN